MTSEEKENIEKAKRAKIAFADETELWMAWFLVFTETKEYAEKVLNTPLA